MALITCPECGAQISEQAAFCPQCGFPIAAKKQPENQTQPVNAAPVNAINRQPAVMPQKKKRVGFGITALIGTLLMLGIIGYGMYDGHFTLGMVFLFFIAMLVSFLFSILSFCTGEFWLFPTIAIIGNLALVGTIIYSIVHGFQMFVNRGISFIDRFLPY